MTHENGESGDGRGVGRRNFLRTVGVAGFVGLGATGAAGTAAGSNHERYIQVRCRGDQQVPPVDTDGFASALFVLGGEDIRYGLSVRNLSNVTGAHVHLGAPGENGPVVAPLFGGPTTDGETSGTIARGAITAEDLTGPLAGGSLDDLLAIMENGNAYVNVHTEANPGGEVRGQVVLGGSRPATTAGNGEVTFLFDTHVHGTYGSLEDPDNVANYFGLMDSLSEDAPDALRVGSGDDLASSVLSSVFDGEHIVDAFNAGGLDYDTFGNHDFDMGPEQARAMVDASAFTWVSANLIDRRTDDVFAAEQGAARFVTEEVGDVTVGITGVINEEAPEITSLGENAQVMDIADSLRATVRDMRVEGVDLVVVLSHVASTIMEEVIAEVDGVDLVLGDHAARSSAEPITVNDTVFGVVGDEYEFLGELTATVENGGMTDVSFTRYSLAEEVEGGLEPSSDVLEVAQGYTDQLDAELGQVIGRTTVPFDTRESVTRAAEANSGNYIADTVRESFGADVAVMNGGGIRTDTLYPAGELTKRDIFSILPFGNTTVQLEISGEGLMAALENGVSAVEDGAGRFPQVSGMSYTWDPDAEPGDRIVEASVGGESIDPSATYTLGTNSFVASGGDGYESFANAEVLVPPEEGQLLSTLVVDAIEAETPISPEVEGRITAVGEESASISLPSLD